MRKIMLLIVLVLNGIILINACIREKSFVNSEFFLQKSAESSFEYASKDDISYIVVQAMGYFSLTGSDFANSKNNLLFTCAKLTNLPDPSGGGKIIIDFGSQSCRCNDQYFRRGVINIIYSGNYMDPGTVITATFDNYYFGKENTSMQRMIGSKIISAKEKITNALL